MSSSRETEAKRQIITSYFMAEYGGECSSWISPVSSDVVIELGIGDAQRIVMFSATFLWRMTTAELTRYLDSSTLGTRIRSSGSREFFVWSGGVEESEEVRGES